VIKIEGKNKVARKKEKREAGKKFPSYLPGIETLNPFSRSSTVGVGIL